MSIETESRLGARCNRIRQVMACEIKPDNRFSNRLQGRSQRVFMDATRLTQPDMQSVCAIVAAPVPVPSCELTAHGTVCKQFSASCHGSQRIRTLGNVSDASGAAADSSVATSYECFDTSVFTCLSCPSSKMLYLFHLVAWMELPDKFLMRWTLSAMSHGL